MQLRAARSAAEAKRKLQRLPSSDLTLAAPGLGRVRGVGVRAVGASSARERSSRARLVLPEVHAEDVVREMVRAMPRILAASKASDRHSSSARRSLPKNPEPLSGSLLRGSRWCTAGTHDPGGSAHPAARRR